MNSKRVFVPLTDEVLYRRPEWIAESGKLTPFNAGLPCYRWLAGRAIAGKKPPPAVCPGLRNISTAKPGMKNAPQKTARFLYPDLTLSAEYLHPAARGIGQT